MRIVSCLEFLYVCTCLGKLLAKLLAGAIHDYVSETLPSKPTHDGILMTLFYLFSDCICHLAQYRVNLMLRPAEPFTE
jgi:hypothetical protein